MCTFSILSEDFIVGRGTILGQLLMMVQRGFYLLLGRPKKRAC